MSRSRPRAVAIGVLAVAALVPPGASAQPPRPNVVIMYADNLGYGEVGIYGGVRGVPTPRLDGLAREGLRLTNFNVETFCTPSRTALLTGRYGIRSGTLAYRLPVTGMTLWEITIAEYLKPLGYATAHFGKWHAGDAAGRAPTHQGFDEWYGIRDSSNESQQSTFNDTPYIWEGRAGAASRPVKEFNLETRRTIDREVTDRAVDFMTRSRRARQPFFLYVPFTHVHFPTLAHPDFAGKTGAGDIGDAMAEMDRNVGVILDTIAKLGIDPRHARHLGERRRRRGAPSVAGHCRTLARLLQHGHGRRHPNALHDPLARPHPCRPRVERDRAWHRRASRPSPTRSGASVPTDRAIDGVEPAPVLRGQAGEIGPGQLHLLRAERTGARGQVARLEAPLRLAGRAGQPVAARR